MKGGPTEGIPAVGAVVFRGDGCVLLVKRGRPPHQGAWTLPGGRVEPLESLETAIVREVKEETGLVVRARGSLGVVDLRLEGYHYAVHEFLCEVDGPHAASPGDDAADIRWAGFDELEALGVSAEATRVIDRARRREGDAGGAAPERW